MALGRLYGWRSGKGKETGREGGRPDLGMEGATSGSVKWRDGGKTRPIERE